MSPKISTRQNDTAKRISESINSSKFRQRILEQCGIIDSSKHLLDHINSLNSCQHIIEVMNQQNSINKYLQEFRTFDSWKKAIGLIDLDKFYAQNLESINDNFNRSYQDLFKSFDVSGLAKQAYEAIGASDYKRMIKHIEELNKSNFAYYNSIAHESKYLFETLKQPSVLIDAIGSLRNTDLFSAAIQNLNNIRFTPEKFDFPKEWQNEINIEAKIYELTNSPDSDSFRKVFLNLPRALQIFILCIFLPLILNIASNLLTPYVSQILLNNNLSQKEKIKKIKKVEIEKPIDYINKLRFICGDNVRLRYGPSKKSKILDKLHFGKVVRYVSRNRRWIKIEYENDEGSLLHGWVYYKYVDRFKYSN